MLRAIGCPYRKQVMIGVLEGAAATHCDEPGISLLWQYHSLVPALPSAQRCGLVVQTVGKHLPEPVLGGFRLYFSFRSYRQG
jgi:hypothetical protein